MTKQININNRLKERNKSRLGIYYGTVNKILQTYMYDTIQVRIMGMYIGFINRKTGVIYRIGDNNNFDKEGGYNA
jgi:hypothetical protein